MNISYGAPKLKKIIIIFGTRPEAIKLAPVINILKKRKKFKVIVCSTGQHREMLNQVLDLFKIKIDIDLNLMKKNQDLFDITINASINLKTFLQEENPDLIMVQGDTTTAFISALAAFYLKTKIAHVEAGLRSNNKFSPYPEEANRRFISVITDFNFAPTNIAVKNLINEGINRKSIFLTGNTIVDALHEMKKFVVSKQNKNRFNSEFKNYFNGNIIDSEYILITLHRREKFGREFENVLQTLKEIAIARRNYKFIYPVHLNPNVEIPVKKHLKNQENFILIPPQNYLNFLTLMNNCKLIITDSGGVQEECYSFRKPVIVMRDVTERQEAVTAGYSFLVGSNSELTKQTFMNIEGKISSGFNFFPTKNPFGNGKSSESISKILEKVL